MTKILKTSLLILSICILQFFNSTKAEATATQCFSRTTESNGKFAIELTDGNGQRTEDCRFYKWTYDILSGQAKNIATDQYTATFDDSLTGTFTIKVTEPTPFVSTFMIGGSPSAGNAVQCVTRPIDNNNGQFIIEAVNCKFTEYSYVIESGSAKLLSKDENTIIFDDTLKGVITIKVTKPTPFESTFDIGGSPSAGNAVQCYTRTTESNGKFVVELTDGNGQRTEDCRFYKWTYDILSGQAKNIATDQYNATFDGALTGTFTIKVTEPTPFESTFMIGGSAKTTNSITPTTIFEPPAGYEDEVLTAFVSNPFPDTNIGKLEGKAAAELYRRAVIGGFPDGEFKGSRSVNRAEAAKFLLLARFGSVSQVSNNGQFGDVLDNQWYTKFVVTAALKGIIGGYPDGSFKPADTVNTAEFLKMLTLTFGLAENQTYSYSDVPNDAWFARYAGTAKHYNLFPGRNTQLKPGEELTRDEVAVAIYQYLSNR